MILSMFLFSIDSPAKLKLQIDSLEKLERIIHHEHKKLCTEQYAEIKSYITLVSTTHAWYIYRKQKEVHARETERMRESREGKREREGGEREIIF